MQKGFDLVRTEAMTSVTVENVKRELEEVDREEHASNAKRNKSEPLNLLWKFW